MLLGVGEEELIVCFEVGSFGSWEFVVAAPLYMFVCFVVMVIVTIFGNIFKLLF